MADETKKPFSQIVAENLITQLKAGTAPWQRPWKAGDPSAFLPMNPTTGKRYKGINAIHLMSQFQSDPRWMTYKQAAAIGAQVRKGEKSTLIQYWKFTDERVKRDATGKPYKDKDGNTVKEVYELERPRVFFGYVFNGAQIDGLPPLESKKQEQDWQVIERAEHILAASGATITHTNGDRAFYRPATDSITLPEKAQFASADNYYATALHELGHWTGHHTRLDRDLAHPFGSEGYAKEELRAEIASMILGVELGIGHDPGQHAAYVKSWVKALEEDHMEIFRAAADAEKIHGYVMAFEQQQTQQQTTQQVVSQERAPAMLDSNNVLLDMTTAQPLASDWRGIAEGEGRYWYIGNDGGERSFTVLTATTLTDAKKEAAIAELLEVDIAQVLNDPDRTFNHFEAFKGETLESALRSRGLTTIGNVTGRDPEQFYDHAIVSLSPVFGIDPDYTETDNAYLERKGLVSAFRDEAERLVMAQNQSKAPSVAQEAVAGYGVPEIMNQGGRLVDRLQQAGVMSHGDALVTDARRDLILATAATLEVDGQRLGEVSEAQLLFKIPPTWTGEVQTRGMVEVEGNVIPAEDAGLPATMHSVYARTLDGEGELTYEWLIDYARPEQAQQMADRLALIDAYSQPNEQERDRRLAATWTAWEQRAGIAERTDGPALDTASQEATLDAPAEAKLSESDARVVDALLSNREHRAAGVSLADDFLAVVSSEELGFALPPTWTGESRINEWAETDGGENMYREFWVQVEVAQQDGTRSFVDFQGEASNDYNEAETLLDRLDTIQAYSLPEESEERMQLLAAVEQRRWKRDSIGSRIPENWTGELAVLPLVNVDGEVKSAQELGVAPEFHGIYLATADEKGEKQWVWLEDHTYPKTAEAIAAQLEHHATHLAAEGKLAKLREANTSTENTYIAVPFKQKNEAKELGAKWDRNHGEKGSWYVPPGVDLTAFEKWMPKAETQAVIASQDAAAPSTSTEAQEAVTEPVSAPESLAKRAYEMTSAEFEQAARAVKLENHGRQWEVFVGEQSYGFADAPEQADAIREAHKREVNNALYFNSEDAPLDAHFYDQMGGKPSVPPAKVLSEYPDLQEKFAAVISATPEQPQGNIATGVTWLAIPYNQRDAAKAAAGTLPDGSKAIGWDKQENSWYAKPGADLDKLKMWLPQNVEASQGPAQTPQDEFADALRAMGCIVDGEHPIMDGQRHRIRVEGDKTKQDKQGGGTYIGHLPEPGARMANGAPEIPAGYIKNHRTQVEMRWKAKGYTFTDEEKAQMHAAAAEKLQKREAEQNAAYERIAKRVAAEKEKLAPITEPTPYMVKKGLVPQQGTYTDADKLTMFIPVYDVAGKQWSTQYINSDGSSKRFAKDSRKEACFHVIGGNGIEALADAPAIVIGEGYSTTACAKQVLGFPAVTAFDSGNLKAVAKAISEKYPDKPLVFLGDDDTHLVNHPQVRRNTGRVKAEEAARELGGTVLFPIFAPGEQASDPAGFTDFNDLATKSVLGPEGLERQVKGFVDDVIAKHLSASQTEEQVEKLVQERVQTQEVKRTRAARM